MRLGNSSTHFIVLPLRTSDQHRRLRHLPLLRVRLRGRHGGHLGRGHPRVRQIVDGSRQRGVLVGGQQDVRGHLHCLRRWLVVYNKCFQKKNFFKVNMTSSGSSGHHIRLWTINGSLVAAQDCRVAIRCVTFSNMDEGTSINVVAGGLENGTVRLWSTWDLSVVRDITSNSVRQPIVWSV